MKQIKFLFTTLLLVLFGLGLQAQSPLCGIAGTNGQAGTFFNVEASSDVTLTSLDGDFDAVSCNVEIWTRAGSHVGFEGSNVGWTLLGSATITGGGIGNPIPLPIPFSLPLLTGEVQAFHLVSTNNTAQNYATGTGTVGVTVVNTTTELTLYAGCGSSGLFAGCTFSPRNFMGCVNYTAGGAPPPPGAECDMYAVTGAGGAASSLYSIDENTGAATLIGATGFTHVTGIDVHPVTGVIYGVVSDLFGSGTAQLITIDENTGAGTVIGNTFNQIPDISFNSAGVLYGWSEYSDITFDSDNLVTIDLGTGAVTEIVSIIGTYQTGLAFDASDNLYLKTGNQIYQIDPATAGIISGPTSLSTFTSDNMLEVDPTTGVFYTGNRVGGGNSALTLQTLDPNTGLLTDVGPTGVNSISAIACGGATASTDPCEGGGGGGPGLTCDPAVFTVSNPGAGDPHCWCAQQTHITTVTQAGWAEVITPNSTSTNPTCMSCRPYTTELMYLEVGVYTLTSQAVPCTCTPTSLQLLGDFYGFAPAMGDPALCGMSTGGGAAEGCCAPDAGTQEPESDGLCVDETGLAPDGSTITVDVVFEDLANQPRSSHAYAWIITDPALNVLRVEASTNYNKTTPANFSDDVDVSGLAVGQYCIHGINYRDGDNPANAGEVDVLTLADIQSITNAGGIAGQLLENDGILTGNETFCADLNVAGCTQLVINPTPEIVDAPLQAYYECEGDIATISIGARVDDTGDPDNVISALVFELQAMTGAGGWITVQTNATDAGGAPGTVDAEFDVVAGEDECSIYRILVTAAHSPGPRCSVASDNIYVVAHQPIGMNCNDKVNVSATANCDFNFNAISFLEGDRHTVCGIDATEYYNAFYEVAYLTPGGARLLEGDDISAFAGQCLDYEVLDLCYGSTCWGTVCIEDKILPTLENCGCEVQGSSDRDDYAEICRLKCYQKDLIQNGIESVLTCDYLPYPTPMDNCQTYPAPFRNLADLAWTDEWIEGECGEWWLQRTFNLFTEVYNEQRGVYERIVADECVFEFFVDSYGVGPQDTIGLNTIDEFAAITDQQVLANTLFLPVAVIELGCGIDPTPAYLASTASGLDLPGNPAPSGDNTTTVGDINVEEANEGIPYGYPFYMAKGWACMSHPQRIEPEVCNIIVDYTDQLLESCGQDCKGNEKTLREWTILDWCAGEVIYWNQVIKTVDTEAPTLAVQNITVSVDPWKCSVDAVMPLPDFLHDNCDDRLVSYLVTNVEGIDVSGDMSTGFVAHDLAKTMPDEPHNFIYEVLDCCGNGAQYAMTVTVVDLTAPTPVTLQNIVLSLTALNPDTSGIAKIFTKDIDNGSYDECSGVHLEIRRATDACGFLGNTTFNNDGHPEDDKDDPDGGQYVKFCCDDLEDDGTGVMKGVVDVVLRVWDDADMNGEYGTAGDNYNESWSTVTIEDKLGGSPQCPPNLVLTCDMSKDDLSMTGVPGPTILTCMTTPVDSTYSDIPKLKRPTDAMELNPQIPSADGSWPPFDPVCRIGAIERTWAACGVQWILFIDNGERFDPETIVYPADEIVECAEFAQGEPTWNEVSCQLIGYSVKSDTFFFEDGACYKVLNDYTVINWCEYDPSDPDVLDPGSEDGFVPGIWSWTQQQKLIDDTNPTLEYTGETCFAVNGECTSDEITLEMVGDDSGDCASPWLKWEVVIDLWGDGTPDHTFTSFTTTNNPFYIAPTARGESLSVVIPEGVDVSKNNHPVYITVSDGCGNVMSQVIDIEITDKKKPTPYCLNLSTALMANGGVELWACDFNAGSFDNCTPQSWLRYTFSAVNPDTLNDTPGLDEIYDPLTQCSGRVFTDADNANQDQDGLIPVDVYVWDECGNYDFCTVRLRLINNLGARASIEGDIRTEEGQEVRDVEVSINSSTPEYPASSMTDGNGHYAFGDNPMYLNYNISSEKNDDYLNGVSTLDLVMIQRHILGVSPLNSAYKMIAADVNSDEGVSSIDLIELRKLILGIYSELPNNGSWRFVVEDIAMQVNNPWPFVEAIDIASLDANMMEENYVGVKIGDVNGSVDLSIAGNNVTETRSRDLELMIENQSYKAGDRVEMAVSSSNFEEISGYQFTMELNNLKLVEVVSGAVNMDMSNVAQLDANTVTVSWNDKVGVTADKDEVLFSLIYEAQESGNTSATAISSSVTRAEAYAGSVYETMGVSLRNGEQVSAVNKLYQNEPNPFSATTLISFELAEAGSVSLKLTDVTGKLLKSVQANYNSGYNTIEIDARDLGLGGVMYYTLESGDFVSTKKMVVIK